MQWVNNLSSYPDVWVGYSVETRTHTHAYSFTNTVLQLDSKRSPPNSENGNYIRIIRNAYIIPIK